MFWTSSLVTVIGIVIFFWAVLAANSKINTSFFQSLQSDMKKKPLFRYSVNCFSIIAIGIALLFVVPQMIYGWQMFASSDSSIEGTIYFVSSDRNREDLPQVVTASSILAIDASGRGVSSEIASNRHQLNPAVGLGGSGSEIVTQVWADGQWVLAGGFYNDLGNLSSFDYFPDITSSIGGDLMHPAIDPQRNLLLAEEKISGQETRIIAMPLDEIYTYRSEWQAENCYWSRFTEILDNYEGELRLPTFSYAKTRFAFVQRETGSATEFVIVMDARTHEKIFSSGITANVNERIESISLFDDNKLAITTRIEDENFSYATFRTEIIDLITFSSELFETAYSFVHTFSGSPDGAKFTYLASNDGEVWFRVLEWNNEEFDSRILSHDTEGMAVWQGNYRLIYPRNWHGVSKLGVTELGVHGDGCACKFDFLTQRENYETVQLYRNPTVSSNTSFFAYEIVSSGVEGTSSGYSSIVLERNDAQYDLADAFGVDGNQQVRIPAISTCGTFMAFMQQKRDNEEYVVRLHDISDISESLEMFSTSEFLNARGPHFVNDLLYFNLVNGDQYAFVEHNWRTGVTSEVFHPGIPMNGARKSPDGSTIGFIGYENPEIQIVAGEEQALRQLYLVRNRFIFGVINGSEQRLDIPELRNADIESFSWSPDGNSLVIAVRHSGVDVENHLYLVNLNFTIFGPRVDSVKYLGMGKNPTWVENLNDDE